MTDETERDRVAVSRSEHALAGIPRRALTTFAYNEAREHLRRRAEAGEITPEAARAFGVFDAHEEI